MQIQPPEPELMETRQLRRRVGAMSFCLIGLAVLLLVTLVAWLMLWGGGMKQAAKVDQAAPAGQTR